MPQYDQINLKLKQEELDMWKTHAEHAGIGMTQFIRNCVTRTITGDSDPRVVNLETENRKLDVLVNGQREVIELLNQLLASREIQAEINTRITETAKHNVDQETLDTIMAFLKTNGSTSGKQASKHLGMSEIKVMEALTLLESEGKVKRNFMVKPNKYEVSD